MRGVGCTVWRVSSVGSERAGTQHQSTVVPRATLLLSITLVWISPRWFIILFSLCQKEVGVNLKASRRCLLAPVFVRAGQGGGRHTFGSGLPVMVLTSSWRCGQLPWEYQPGLSSDGSPSLSSTSFTAGREERESDTTVGPNRQQLRDRRHRKPQTAEHRRTHQQSHTETE